jgi:hypothetical protein
MTTLSQDIRGALHARAITAAGFPASVAEEGMPFTPQPGATWARLTFRPAAQRPFGLAEGAVKTHKGLYLVDVYAPAGNGTAGAESLADAVRTVFAPATKLILDSEYVIIDYSERAPAVLGADWSMVPVTIGWRCFSTR